MAKGYWVGCYREIKDPDALADVGDGIKVRVFAAVLQLDVAGR